MFALQRPPLAVQGFEKMSPASASKNKQPPLNSRLTCEVANRGNFSFIKYAQCWEDTDLVLEGMAIEPGDTCLSIASAGDNTLAILSKNPTKVVALDLSKAQLALLELKAAAFRMLNYHEMLGLLGYEEGHDRVALFAQVSSVLTQPSYRFWAKNIDLVEKGLASSGKFESYFRLFRTRVLPLIHSKSTVDELLLPKWRGERNRFYNGRWNSLGWKLLFRVFFSKFVMGKLGRDASFFKYANGNLPERLLQTTRQALVEQDPSTNPYLHWILRGEFQAPLPFYLRKENFAAIKRNIEKLEIREASLEQYLSSKEAPRFDSFNLSDIFEYMSVENYEQLLAQIKDSSTPGARLVYWNMMVDRCSSNTSIKGIKEQRELSSKLFKENKTFFYSKFIIEEIAT